jgi:hypothetical protein
LKDLSHATITEPPDGLRHFCFIRERDGLDLVHGMAVAQQQECVDANPLQVVRGRAVGVQEFLAVRGRQLDVEGPPTVAR